MMSLLTTILFMATTVLIICYSFFSIHHSFPSWPRSQIPQGNLDNCFFRSAQSRQGMNSFTRIPRCDAHVAASRFLCACCRHFCSKLCKAKRRKATASFLFSPFSLLSGMPPRSDACLFVCLLSTHLFDGCLLLQLYSLNYLVLYYY